MSSATDRSKEPIQVVLPGFELDALPDRWTPLQAFVLVKALDEQGKASWVFRTSEPFNLNELLGALCIQVDWLRSKLASWEQDEDS